MIHFISDLHLSASRPASAEAFLAYLAGPARQCETLWILGDLFEFWIGDDDLSDPFNARIADALAALKQTGVDIRMIIGNRDFLLGKRFEKRAGVRLVTEPIVIELGQQRTVLLHGDAQCTDDHAYQRYRRKVRNPALQFLFARLPLSLRRRITLRLREGSARAMPGKADYVMDVNAEAIASVFRESGAAWMIHGHTHRPARHEHSVDSRACVRWVLADWHDHAVWLAWDGQSLQTHQAI